MLRPSPRRRSRASSRTHGRATFASCATPSSAWSFFLHQMPLASLGVEPEPAAGEPPVDLHVPFKDAKNALTERFERRYLTAMPQSTGGNISKAARRADIDRVYLLKLLGRYGLRKGREGAR